jgi:hypothetical protein
MARKKHTVEQIIGTLREAAVALSKGQTVVQVCETVAMEQGPRDIPA